MSKQHTMAERLQQLEEARTKVEAGGGAEKLEKQRARGKMTARDRIEELIDEGSFQETGAFRRNRTTTFGMDKAYMAADGVVTGSATVLGRPVHLASQDFTVMGGSAGETHSIKVTEMLEASLSTGTPFIFINDSGGARVQEGIDSLSGYGKVFYANVLLSGAVPQISIISGPCAGGAAYSPALTDFIIQTRKAHMFITGPGVIKQVTGEEVTQDALGGADAHMGRSGVIDFVADDDEQAILIAKKLLSFLPQNNSEEPPIVDPDDSIEPNEKLREIIPLEGNKGYDIRDIIAEIVGYGANCDGSHITRPEMRTMQRCIELALEDAALPPSAVGYVSGHGTATEQGDIAETQATAAVFGHVPISSQKSYLGHTLGACGSLESWFAVEMMRGGWFAPTLNLDNIDPRCGEADYLTGSGRHIDTEYVMNNNFAFGGVNTSLIFKRW